MPVDVMILQVLTSGEQANPIRVRYQINEQHNLNRWGKDDWSLDYITQRMGTLRQFGLLERVPPDDSGIYRLTDTGRVVLQHWIETGETEFDVVEAHETAKESPVSGYVEPEAISPDIRNQ